MQAADGVRRRILRARKPSNGGADVPALSNESEWLSGDDGALSATIFGWMRMSDPSEGSAGVPARPQGGPPPLAGRAEEHVESNDGTAIKPDREARA